MQRIGVAALTDGEVVALGEGRVVVRDGVLGPDLARSCRGALESHVDALRPAGVGRERVRDPAIRGDDMAWLGDLVPEAPSSPLGQLHAWFDALRVELNRSAWLGLIRFSVQVARYPGDGAGYAAHTDALAGSPNRRVTAIVYLNPGWVPADGGQLRAREPDGWRAIDPVLDRLVLFLSDRVEHEVTPVHRPRWAATAWYRGAEALPLLHDVG